MAELAEPAFNVGDKVVTQGLDTFPHLDNRIGVVINWVSDEVGGVRPSLPPSRSSSPSPS